MTSPRPPKPPRPPPPKRKGRKPSSKGKDKYVDPNQPTLDPYVAGPSISTSDSFTQTGELEENRHIEQLKKKIED